MFTKYFFPNGENPNATGNPTTSVPALGRVETETSNASRRGLMVQQTGSGLQGTTAFLPAVTSVANGLSSKKAFGKTLPIRR